MTTPIAHETRSFSLSISLSQKGSHRLRGWLLKKRHHGHGLLMIFALPFLIGLSPKSARSARAVPSGAAAKQLFAVPVLNKRAREPVGDFVAAMQRRIAGRGTAVGSRRRRSQQRVHETGVGALPLFTGVLLCRPLKNLKK